MSRLRDYICNKSEMSERDYQRSKLCFVIDGSFSAGAMCFVGTTYLTGLLGAMGTSEALSNFILSLVLPTGLIQIFAPLLSKRLTYKKPFVYVCRFFDKLLQILAFLVPFFLGTGELAIAVMCLLLVCGNLTAYIMTPFYNDIFVRCASHGGGLGRFCGTKDSISNVCSAVCSFLAGMIAKRTISGGSIDGYKILGIIALVFWAVEIIGMFFVKEPYEPPKPVEKTGSYRKIFSDLFTEEKLKSYLKFTVAYNGGAHMVSTLMSILCIQRVHISLEYMSYLSVATLATATLLAPVLGNLSDKIGNKKVLLFGLACLGTSYILYGFMNEHNALVFKTIASVLTGVSNASITAPAFSLLCSVVPDDERPEYFSCISTLTMIVGYCASLIATAVLGVAKGFHITLFGISIYEINLLFFVALLMLVFSGRALIRMKK